MSNTVIQDLSSKSQVRMAPGKIEQKRDALIDRMLQSMSGVFDIFTIYIGHRLNLYRHLADGGPQTAAQLAARSGTQGRYIREWLEQQTVAGILETEDDSLNSSRRRYFLPAGHDEVLVDQDSLNYLSPLAQLVVAAARPVPAVVEAFTRGGGVPYADYGPDLVQGQGDMNRAMFLQELGQNWLPSIADIHARLLANPPARVADIGCGTGWSSIGIANAYPNAQIDGFDLDQMSIDLAWTNAQKFNLNGRLSFHVRDASDPELNGKYDLVTAFECLHDMSDPVGALKTMRSLAGSTGTVIVVDERVGESFQSDGNEIDWMMYGWSVLHCLPVGMADQPSAETGTVMRPNTLRRYALEAGFRKVEVLPIDNFFFRFYRLHQ